jgi:hypothetical protein
VRTTQSGQTDAHQLPGADAAPVGPGASPQAISSSPAPSDRSPHGMTPDDQTIPTPPAAGLAEVFDHPERLGPYHILQPLGEGCMGVVYEAAQTAPVRRRVALKILKVGIDTKEVVARFEVERQGRPPAGHAGAPGTVSPGAGSVSPSSPSLRDEPSHVP